MPCVAGSSVIPAMNEIFTIAQESKAKHRKLLKKLKTLYENANKDEFTKAFINCLKVPFTVIDNNAAVMNTMHFTAIFATSLLSSNDEATDATNPEIICSFLAQLIYFLLKSHDAVDIAVRYRVCHFLNLFLNSMGEDALLDDEFFEKIQLSLTHCLLDKSPKVRAQAAYALHRLQEPSNDQCPVIKLYLFHLSKDPSSEVRRAVISSIGRNGKALQAILQRTRDVSDTVRKAAYIFISKILVRSLTIRNREALLREGLKDRSESVRRVIKEVLLPAWLQHLNNNFMDLIRALDAETNSETISMVLPILFDKVEKTELMKEVPLDLNEKLILIDHLTSENVLFWKCLVDYFHQRQCTDLVDECLPELSKFCDYISKYQEKMASGEYSNIEKMAQQFILYQLFEISKTYDLSDEAGRSNLKQLIIDTLLNENHTGKIVDSLVKYCEKVIPDVSTRLNCLAHIISDIRVPMKIDVEVEQITDDEQHERLMQIQRIKISIVKVENELYNAVQKEDFIEAQRLKQVIVDKQKEIGAINVNPTVPQTQETCEEKNDPDTMVKCLQIMCGMAQAPSIKTLTPVLRSLFDNMALNALVHMNNTVHISALKAVGICLLLDKELAKKHWMIYLLQFTEEDRDVWIIALKVIFDLFLLYGLDYFDVAPEDSENNSQNESSKSRTGRPLFNNTEEDITGFSLVSESENNNNIVKIMLALLEHGDQDIRTITTEGFCKLLLHGKLCSMPLISRLIVLLHNPVNDDDVNLRHCLITFFKTYILKGCQSHEVLARAFLPTLRIIENAPEGSPLQAIDPNHISDFVLGLTDSKLHKPEMQNYTVHNELAFSILAEILTPKYHIDREVLLKALTFLNVSYDEENKKDIKEALEKIAETMTEMNRNLKTYLKLFSHKVEGKVTQQPEEQQEQPQQKQSQQQEENEDELMEQNANEECESENSV